MLNIANFKVNRTILKVLIWDDPTGNSIAKRELQFKFFLSLTISHDAPYRQSERENKNSRGKHREEQNAIIFNNQRFDCNQP